MAQATRRTGRARLLRLANGLASLPFDYKHFDMKVFFHSYATSKEQMDIGYSADFKKDRDPGHIHIQTPEHCGTAGCAVGHAPSILGKIKGVGKKASWARYSKMVFGIPTSSDDWYWMFCDSWAAFDDTPHGAAKRIQHYLDHGVPKTWAERFAHGAGYRDASWKTVMKAYVADYEAEYELVEA